ncbi:G-type lectin S-receptor-like serine/threonine-protein kinase At4g27290 isoform X2 [Citrus clementina]|uniref:G-type lectin S-receptor-like serine/threonine-protein kinase At4g27290 isoform X2 n=1 Tax=Citrus clementina TaxID=85681 RepID=UPI000CED1796|nr:G-type lectin S-receptor-like serine/threonine-protein kinase At4g27290 isoform X2 [Citrus x clementina]
MSMIRQMEGLKILIIYSFLFCNIRTASTRDAISLGQSIREGETVVSASESFELGFFSPGKSKSRYLGIWFKKIATGTVTWVANRDAPLSDRSGVLSMSRRGNGTALVLLNSTNDVVWSSNIVSRAAQNPVAVLLESGNLVVKEKDGNDNDDPDHFLWQSFDYPSHTLLAGMKLGVNLVTGLNRLMSSWKSADDPARSEYTYGIDPSGVPQAMLKKGSTIRYRAGSWNGLHWTGMPQLQPNPVYTFEFVSNENEVFYRFKLINSSVPTMMVINTIGDVQRFTWMEHTKKWGLFARFSGTILDQCDNYALCGPYASCNIHSDSPDCECLEGFEPKSPGDWYMLDKSGGCGRKTPLNCKHGDGFLKLKTVKVPDTRYAQVDKNIILLECKELCSRNCSCTAYANSDVRGGGSGCLLWFHDLIDIKVLPEIGQDIYVRMAASELGMLSFLPVPSAPGNSSAKQVTIIITSILLATGVILLGAIVYIWKKKHRNYGKTDDRQELYSNEKGSSKEEMELPIFDWKTIVDATDNFSEENKLGEGGFGPGMLIEGQEIAVKRLSKSSGQGVEEFKNEALLIAKLQHRNLVKLLGCCTQRDERVLVYEYLPNKSLDYFIFDTTRSKVLDWQNRCHIIGGIARGLLYLHHDSRLRIIHRDLKASNVLLDNEMNPKISDFGMARAFGLDQTEANTNRVVGTYGYMSPEYAIDGLFSVKSDVFSFGVLVLEIVSGKRNRGFYHADHRHNLLGHAWQLWIQDRPAELIDKSLYDSCSLSEAIRCIQVGLLCVQQIPEDRPNMLSVVLMLSGERSLPQPKQPGFFTERNLPESESSSSKQNLSSTNEISFSMLEAR